MAEVVYILRYDPVEAEIQRIIGDLSKSVADLLAEGHTLTQRQRELIETLSNFAEDFE